MTPCDTLAIQRKQKHGKTRKNNGNFGNISGFTQFTSTFSISLFMFVCFTCFILFYMCFTLLYYHVMPCYTRMVCCNLVTCLGNSHTFCLSHVIHTAQASRATPPDEAVPACDVKTATFIILSGSKCSNKEELPQPQIWNRLQSALQRIGDIWFEKFGRSSPFSGRPLCSWSETDQAECCCTKAPSAAMAIWMSLAGWVGDCYGSGAVLTSSRRPCRKTTWCKDDIQRQYESYESYESPKCFLKVLSMKSSECWYKNSEINLNILK